MISTLREWLGEGFAPSRIELFSAGLATDSLAAVVHDYNVSHGRDPGELVQGVSRWRQVGKACPAV
jgi:hypothetical protein